MMNCSEEELIYHSYRNQYLCGYTNMIMCIIGTFCHLSVVIVYTRKNMISPMNTILAHSSAASLVAVVAYIPHSWHEFFRSNWYTIEQHREEFWETFSLYSWYLAAIFTHVSTGIAIMMGVWRYIAVIHPLRERAWCNMKNTRKTIAACYLMGVLVTVPAICDMKIVGTYKILDVNGFIAENCTAGVRTKIYMMKIIIEDNDSVYFVTFLLYGLFLKTLPSIVLSAISIKLILALKKAKIFHLEMNQISRRCSNDTNSSYSRNDSSNNGPTDRTTKMLLMILALFIFAELPNGIFCTLTALYGRGFYHKYYYPSWEVINTISHICANSHFIVYYIMCRRFRETFKIIFSLRTYLHFSGQHSPSPPCDISSLYRTYR